ncbi:MAG TPA: heparinase II/III family protein [Gemmataceae bacterium]|nr:heparinase II/III family protein [Gemmataceae bacterium]
MKTYVTGLAGLLFLSLLARGLQTQGAPAQAAPPAPVLNVPREHPRIFFTKNDLAEFKKWMNGKPVTAGASGRAAIRGHGFNYVVLGDKESAERAIQAALSLCRPGLGSTVNSHFEDIFDIAICYDWCHAALSPEAKTRLATTLAEAMDKYDYTTRMRRGPGHNMTTENALGALAAGLALYGEHPNAAKWIREACKAVLDEAMNGYLDKLCPDGGDFEGTQYHGARYQGEAIFAWLLLKGAGINVFTPQYPHLMNGVNWWIYILEPHLNYQHLQYGDTNHRGIMARNVLSALCLACGADDPYAAWYASKGPIAGWEAVVFRPKQIKAPSEGLPPYKFFRMGMAVIRSGWDIGPGSRDTLFTFICRDYMLGWHCHQDANHFTLSRRGELAIDSGVYRGNSPHMYDYARRTIAHNSMLIYDPAEPLPPHVRTRDGGQVCHHDPQGAWMKRTGLTEIAWRTYDTADFKTFGVGDTYYYLCGDATRAYNLKDFKKCEWFTREIIYIKEIDPPVIVIFDRVVATKPTSKKTWLLHTHEEPRISGMTVIVREQEGQLTVQSLLPANPQIRVVGGPGKEYWVDDPGINVEASVYGRWRLEVSPSTEQASDLFLTVLYPCDPGSAPPASRVIARGGRTGCEVAVAGKKYEILFNTKGDNGGTFNGQPFATTDPNAARATPAGSKLIPP